SVARAQRHPADLARIAQRQKRDQRRRINRRRVYGVRAPLPLIANIGPAAVVIRRVAPRLARNPGWTIGIISRPVALLIRNPARVNARPPGVAVTVHVLPVAVISKIVQTGNDRRRILVTEIVLIRIVVIRIAKVNIIAVLTAVVVGILITIIIVDQITGIVAVDA